MRSIGCLTQTPIYENKIDATGTPYRAEALLSETVARTGTAPTLAAYEIEAIDYDSGADYRMCWHTGFHDPTTPPECGPRHSCEARVVLITPYSDDGDRRLL